MYGHSIRAKLGSTGDSSSDVPTEASSIMFSTDDSWSSKLLSHFVSIFVKHHLQFLADLKKGPNSNFTYSCSLELLPDPQITPILCVFLFLPFLFSLSSKLINNNNIHTILLLKLREVIEVCLVQLRFWCWGAKEIFSWSTVGSWSRVGMMSCQRAGI